MTIILQTSTEGFRQTLTKEGDLWTNDKIKKSEEIPRWYWNRNEKTKKQNEHNNSDKEITCSDEDEISDQDINSDEDDDISDNELITTNDNNLDW